MRHRDELLGALSVRKATGESLTANESKLVDDLAAQAGLVLRNVALTEQLRMRLEELRASRQRLVGAQDEERRKIERNIHDGAQQQLVALAVKQRLAASLIGKDDERAGAMLARAPDRDERGARRPPRPGARDLPAAACRPRARRRARGAGPEGRVASIGRCRRRSGRFPQDVEATVYFCTLEALQNVAKYAEATRATVRLSNGERRAPLRGHRRRTRVRLDHDRLRHRSAGDGRPARRRRRRADGTVGARRRHDDRRNGARMSAVATRRDVQRDRWVPRLARLAIVVVVVVGTGGLVLAALQRETGDILGALAASRDPGRLLVCWGSSSRGASTTLWG